MTPGDYHVAQIAAMVIAVRRDHETQTPLAPDRLADLDLLLTDAFLLYGSHLLVGRVNPALEYGVWGVQREKVDLARVLQTALDTNDITTALQSLLPSQPPAYAKLRRALAHYQQLAAIGGWPVVPGGPKLRVGHRGERVTTLRARLRAEGDLRTGLADSEDLFDDTLEQAVRHFQRRYGLDVDGVVGPATLAMLNVPVETRARQIALNMERWRWLPREVGPHAVIVNVAGFTLEVMENHDSVMTMRIVAGKPATRTPVFHTFVTAVELNPAWHVPTSIAVKEMLPLIRRNPQYLVKHHLTVLQGWGTKTQVIDPTRIAWARISERHFPYRFRQEPGPWNALGRVKIHLPNPFTVYLHDTPTQELFARTVRAFSHGCIRIEKPIEFAEHLLRGTEWTRDTLLAAINQGVERTIRLPKPIPIYVGYWTAWIEQDSTLHFRADLYGRDRRLDQALRSAPAGVRFRTGTGG
jgi:murein L,D-transpeptidase YcbB/YkuD